MVRFGSVSYIYIAVNSYIIPPSDHFFDVFNRRVLVMEYIDGIPILKMGDEMAKRGINPSGKLAVAAKQ